MDKSPTEIHFPSPLEKVTLIKRYKRFLCDVKRESGEEITVHCANSGSMKSCFEAGWAGWISDSGNPKRKLRHTLELVDNGKGLIGVNTAMANRVVEKALRNRTIPELKKYTFIKREAVFTKGTRFDFYGEEADYDGENREKAFFLEVKSVSLSREDVFSFPDAVTTRGQKHIRELLEAQKQGYKPWLLFLLMRNDGNIFQAAKDIDPDYAQLLCDAAQSGLNILVYRTQIKDSGISLGSRLETFSYC